MEFCQGLVVGIAVGIFAFMGTMSIAGTTPQDTARKMCIEADWKLPSCKEKLERAISEVKGGAKR